MSCKKCSKEPTYHSFEFVSRLPTGEALFYTCPARGKHRNMKEEDILDFVAHMDEASVSSWAWVFDCSGLESFHLPNMSVLQKFTNIIQDRYKYVLTKVYIMNINWKMHIILNLVKPFMKDEAKDRLKILDSRLEVVSLGLGNQILVKMNNKS